MTAYWILLGCGGLFFLLLSFPIKIRINSSPIFRFQASWAFINLSLVFQANDMEVDFRVFYKKINFAEKPKKAKKEPAKKPTPETVSSKKKKKTKAKKRFTFSFLQEIYHHPAIHKLLPCLLRYGKRLIKAGHIKQLKWDFGLKDFYYQGLLTGLTSMIPQRKRIKIQGNFEETNRFHLILHISIWKILSATTLLLIFFPYQKTFRLVKMLR
ncbi:MAG: hypothetical protein COB67_07305 [SAR324 cluster bacterium]|uniref:DUF2953 domain-containing protein n=1 Tax=SAR324 cluster bacterium TaxID=2024889 RepID=A0A2A4T3V1_9DELT|nr:MAG: hypothetical protein COB67_07305 [SAR324 cluster bacterium]